MVQWILGMDSSGPSEVIPPEHETDEFGAKSSTPNPLRDYIIVTHVKEILTPAKKSQNRGLLFIGEKGQIFANASSASATPKIPGTAGQPTCNRAGQNAALHHGNWFDCIRPQQPVADVPSARERDVLPLLNLAYWHRKKLKWGSADVEFTGVGGDAWRDRPRREKYQCRRFDPVARAARP